MTDPMKRFPDLVAQLLFEDFDTSLPPHITNTSHANGCGCDGLSDCSHEQDSTTITSPSHSVAVSQRSATAPSVPYLATATTDSSLPTKTCTFHANGLRGIGQGCLRVNCTYFHGTEEQLTELRLRVVASRSSKNSTTTATAENDLQALPTVQRVKRGLVDTDLGDKLAIVCLAHLSNSCRRPGCRFLHLLPNIRPLPIAVCERSERGVCNLRSKCRFFHGKQEDLARMHAEGVTLYDPFTGEPHDPTASIGELMQLQQKTTVKAAVQPPAPAYSEPQRANQFHTQQHQQVLQPQIFVISPFMFPGPAAPQNFPMPQYAQHLSTFCPMPMYPQMMYQSPPAQPAHAMYHPHQQELAPTFGGTFPLRHVDEHNSTMRGSRAAIGHSKYTAECQGFL
eukprot:GILI01023534.1.p1 GENE.GILI01023534.1~~GILI01023534.1.p1  ORF type:complete len:395 (+),score=54.36 GILI01023534.1:95-1279(+)